MRYQGSLPTATEPSSMPLNTYLQYPQPYYQQQQQQLQFSQSQPFYFSDATSLGTTTATAFRNMQGHSLMMPRTGQGNGYGSAYAQGDTPVSSSNLSKAQVGVAPPTTSNQDQWVTSTPSTYMKNISLSRTTEPSTTVSASNALPVTTSALGSSLPVAASIDSLQTPAPASMAASAPASSTTCTSSLASSIPSYLQAYISTEPLFSIRDKNSDPDKNLEDGDGTYRPLSSALFSQSRELRQLLDKITSLDSVLDNFQRYFDDYQRKMTEGLISREEATKILETKAGETVVATLSQRSQDMMGSIKECMEEALESQVNEMNIWIPSFQEQMHRTTRMLQDQVQQVGASQIEMAQELGLWKNSIEASVTNEMKSMKSMMELQAQMLAKIAEQHRGIHHEHSHVFVERTNCKYDSSVPERVEQTPTATPLTAPQSPRCTQNESSPRDIDCLATIQAGCTTITPTVHHLSKNMATSRTPPRSRRNKRPCQTLSPRRDKNHANIPVRGHNSEVRIQSRQYNNLSASSQSTHPESRILVSLTIPKALQKRVIGRRFLLPPPPCEPSVQEVPCSTVSSSSECGDQGNIDNPDASQNRPMSADIRMSLLETLPRLTRSKRKECHLQDAHFDLEAVNIKC